MALNIQGFMISNGMVREKFGTKFMILVLDIKHKNVKKK